MKQVKQVLGILFSVFMLGACSEQTTGPVEVHWDRDTCERCRMVLSDRKHAAQIRYQNEKQKSEVKFFDDIGCAVIWLQNKPWHDADSTEIWVTDHHDGSWIDAKTAYYITGEHTPMAFGLGAQQDKTEGTLNFAAAQKYILEKEAATGIHGGHMSR